MRNATTSYLTRIVVGALLLAACAYLLSAALRAPETWTIQIGAEGDNRFSTGFFLREESGGLPFRWSSPDARLILHGADASPLAIELLINGSQIIKSGDPHLSIVAEQPSASGPISTTFSVNEGWQRYRVLLPPSDAKGAAPSYALVSGTSRPGPQDGRDLGAALSTVRLIPITENSNPWWLQGLPLHPRALAYTWLIAVLACAAGKGVSLLRTWRNSTKASDSGWHWPIVLLVGTVVTLALVVWARLTPYSLAWVLPPLPWFLSVATVALVARPLIKLLSQLSETLPYPYLLWGGGLLLLIAQGLFNAQTFLIGAIVLMLLALSLIVVAERRAANDKELNQHKLASIKHPLWWLAGIFVLALGLRFYDLANLPFGLWRDEARHGLYALRILEDPSYRPVYIAEGGVNMPALTFYFFALEFKLWGIHAWTMRPFTALAGALSVLPLYGLTRRLFSERIALLAALLYACSAWHITVSRFSFSTVFDPFFGLTGLWLLSEGWHLLKRDPQQRRYQIQTWLLWLLGGIFVGLAIQTYHTGRVVPGVAGLLALGYLWQIWYKSHKTPDKRPRFELTTQWLISVVALGLGVLIAAGPMLWYALTREAEFNDRVSGVFLLSEDALKGGSPLAALDTTLGKHLLLYNVRGDENGRHAPPNRPGFDFVSGFGLLLGCALIARRAPNGTWPGLGWRGLFLIGAIGISMVPSAFAVDAPHGMRSVGSIAFACVVAALGLEWFLRLLLNSKLSLPQAILQGAAATLVLLVVALNYSTYFVQMRQDPAVWVSFYPVHTKVGEYVREIRQTDPDRQIFVAAGIATNPVFVYLNHGYSIQTFDAGVASEPIRPGAIFVLSGYTYEKDREILADYLGQNPQALATGVDFPDGRSPSFVVYAADPSAIQP